MKIHFCAAILLGCLAQTALGQTAPPRTAEPAYRAPAGPGGHPDLNGVWQVLNTANYDLEPHHGRAAMALRPGPYGPVPAKDVLALGAVGAVPAGLGVVEGGRIPYKPETRARKRDNQQHWLERDPEIKCYLPGVPRATYMPYPFQIFHSEQALLFVYEYAGATRNILFKDPGPAPVDSWMGDSIGRWEGDTLVVETTNLHPAQRFTGGSRHRLYLAPTAKVTERFTRVAADKILYGFTVEDATAYTQTWRGEMPMRAAEGPMYEYACHEGNHSLGNILRGARYEERKR